MAIISVGDDYEGDIQTTGTGSIWQLESFGYTELLFEEAVHGPGSKQHYKKDPSSFRV